MSRAGREETHWTDLLTCCCLLKSDGHLFDSSPAQGVSLPLGRKQSQLLLLVLTEAVAIPEHHHSSAHQSGLLSFSQSSLTWLHYREAAVVGAAAWSDISLPPSWRRAPCRQAAWRSRGGPAHRERTQQLPHQVFFFQRKLIMSDNFPSPSVIISNNSGLGYE